MIERKVDNLRPTGPNILLPPSLPPQPVWRVPLQSCNPRPIPRHCNYPSSSPPPHRCKRHLETVQNTSVCSPCCSIAMPAASERAACLGSSHAEEARDDVMDWRTDADSEHKRTFQISMTSHRHSHLKHPTWLPQLSSRCQSMVYTSPRYPFLPTTVSASHCTLLHGCVISGLQSMAPKATSPPHLVARRSTIIRLIYSPVVITMYHKASHISASKEDPSSTFNVRAVSA